MLSSVYEAALFLVLLIVTMLVTMRVGHRIGLRARESGVDVTKGMGTIEGGLLGLLGLILAFQIFNEQTRFEKRIDVTVEQINSLATAWDQTSLLPEPARTKIRTDLTAYVRAHVEAFRSHTDKEQKDPARLRAEALHEQMWNDYVQACQTIEPEYCANMLLPTINRIEETALTHLIALQTHTPVLVMVLLLLLSGCCGAIAGYSMAAQPTKRLRLHRIAYVVVFSVTFYTIIDLEYPRRGLITIMDAVDPGFSELQRRMARDDHDDGAPR